MMRLYVFKERLKSLYGKYGAYIVPAWKFVVSVVAFLYINRMTGQQKYLKNPLVSVALGMICAFLPQNAIIAVASVYLLAQFYAISLEVTIIMLVLMLLMFMLYYSIKPGSSLLMLLTPLSFVLRVPYALPLCLGLTCGISSIVPAVLGTLIYYIILYVNQNMGQLMSGGSAMDLQRYTVFIDTIINNRMILLTVLTFTVTILVVHIIRKLTIDYAWSVAIGFGAITEITILLIGDFVFEVSISIVGFLVSMLLSVLIAFALEFFLFAVDYSRTEYTQFEDDDYYYYVKAVPKIVVTKPEIKIQKFTSGKRKKNDTAPVKKQQ